jgi:hypothetical protein
MLDDAGDVVGPAGFDEHDLARIGTGHRREIAVASRIRRLDRSAPAKARST